MGGRYGVLKSSSLEKSDLISEKGQAESKVYRSIQDIREDWIDSLLVGFTARLDVISKKSEFMMCFMSPC